MFIIIKRDIPSSINENIMCDFEKAAMLLTKPCHISFIFEGFFNDDETQITKDNTKYTHLEERLEQYKAKAIAARQRSVAIFKSKQEQVG
ncbi:hypothetical protein MTBPR1_80183 [Candidatus Terasakiella magnetica]|uniref:Uncharacterized protein n=1 Tax=Candidatus Terasakiella magnetica TaxID=1867952 RepID=A0A1C3RLV7_9PROT|nr:hypothetical protein [Candidatus Terasakiella magnetica]SCA58129.1 hypothetical protein MTBPR1_80183 [Candidatus Terasakiella magnetica]